MVLPVCDERCHKLLLHHLFCLLLSGYWRFWDSVCAGSDWGFGFLWLGMDSYVQLSKLNSFLFYLCDFCLKTCQEIEFCIWLPLYSFKISCFPLVHRWSVNCNLPVDCGQLFGWSMPLFDLYQKLFAASGQSIALCDRIFGLTYHCEKDLFPDEDN